jgi:glycine hydroxymethyltransferase
MPDELNFPKIVHLLKEHESWRSSCMNLIASENALSSTVFRLLDNDLVQRYGNYAGRDLHDRRYAGNRYIEEMEVGLSSLVSEVFGASQVELRAISGHVAGLSVIMSTCRPGDSVVELAGQDGGHRLAAKAAESPLINLKIVPIPFDPARYNIDTAALCDLLKTLRPRLVILGASNFLFPHPVREVAACLKDLPGTILAYDASHVLGLIACGTFQQPLLEGAHVVFGSTHKTLPGPQGGLIFSNDYALMDSISRAVYPGIVTNHHLFRVPALAAALLEMRAHPEYGRKVIENARCLGQSLSRHGIPVVALEHGCTDSHTVLLRVHEFGTGKSLAAALEAHNVITSHTNLPEALGKEGIRLGTAEITRLGAEECHIEAAAGLIAAILKRDLSGEPARQAIAHWAATLPGLRYADF